MQESLEKFGKTIKSLDPGKRIAAAKWLEGVIVAQSLTAEERENLVKASNQYIEDVEETEYAEAVNTIIGYLARIQKNAKRALKKKASVQKKKLDPVAV